MTGRLLICDPPAQTAAEIADALQASRSAVGAAVDVLEKTAGGAGVQAGVASVWTRGSH